MKVILNHLTTQSLLPSLIKKLTIHKNQQFQELFHQKLYSSNLKSNLKSNSKINNKLMNACYEFEGIFINSMLKSMRKTLKPQQSLIHGGNSEEIFKDMLYEKYALQIAKTANFGLASNLYRQIQSKVT